MMRELKKGYVHFPMVGDFQKHVGSIVFYWDHHFVNTKHIKPLAILCRFNPMFSVKLNLTFSCVHVINRQHHTVF